MSIDEKTPPPVAGQPVSLPRLLKILGAMLGTPHRWGGGAMTLEVPMPARIDDPEAFMEKFLRKNGLKATPQPGPSGGVDHVVVSPE